MKKNQYIKTSLSLIIIHVKHNKQKLTVITIMKNLK
jgi:hypothetical protein